MAIGFGSEAKKPEFARILQYIAGAGNPVFQITDVNTLKNMVKTIKASACSGKFTSKKCYKLLTWFSCDKMSKLLVYFADD